MAAKCVFCQLLSYCSFIVHEYLRLENVLLALYCHFVDHLFNGKILR